MALQPVETMNKITATILTFNEELRIEGCLKSLGGVVDEIVVVDSFSTDSTVEICKRYGCRVRQRHLSGYGAQRQYATSLASNDYVLSIDADETLSPELAEQIRMLKETGFTHRVYLISRLNFFCGRPVRHSGWYPDRQIRLFDRRYANWNLRDVQERVIFRDSVRPELLAGEILHYRCDTPQEYFTKKRRQAEISAAVLAASDAVLPPFTPLWAGIKAFVRKYIGEHGIADGLVGITIGAENFHCARMAVKRARIIRKAKNKDEA